ncbi:dTMP kinase [Limosilactobacillus gastricus]|uniref:Thymidylate kinase n=1 Tax=Limosilactobacillus gastricus DSM 16045 TaxID=1423749 RepID=A0A0R1VDY4_9LACO|nr:dTMP kinase [Limosilactobacillus gastricus]KRM03697.1 Thymidylate kinase [Limosilactobacillus gastricus DSM 16045]QGF39879.1 dTMP kinase [Limosilactobacillus gastricus]
MTGKFISFEGPDGAGKTSVIKAIVDRLADVKLANQVVLTREPGGTPIGEAIRDLLLSSKSVDMDGWTEAYLFAASRRQHVVEKIKPALKSNQIVICDRFVDSSVAYQGQGRQLGFDQIWELNQAAVGDCLPDLTFVLDLPIEEGLQRIAQHRTDQINRLDEETLTFYQRVRQGFLKQAQRDPQRIVVVNASQELTAVVKNVWHQMAERWPELKNEDA